MDGNAVAPGDKARHRVAGHGGAALGELYKAVGHARHNDARIRVAGHLLQGVGQSALGGGAFCLDSAQPGHFLLDAVDRFLRAHSAVADGGV
ncbi:hypothetical protein SDC9_209708 [bioreactor metagenome]|uniref:Uncharacterized protein n=1 Tax=bioreactor metagenome TaxID=1076179 RepID=A0A645JFI7_9ZZZZ